MSPGRCDVVLVSGEIGNVKLADNGLTTGRVLNSGICSEERTNMNQLRISVDSNRGIWGEEEAKKKSSEPGDRRASCRERV